MISSVNFLPHGMQIIPQLDNSGNMKFQSIHSSMNDITKYLAKENPDIIILFTPHGYNLHDSFLVYQHNFFVGRYFAISEEESVVHGEFKYTREWYGDTDLSNALKVELDKQGCPVESLVQGFPDYPMTLAWGETVPLYYLPKDTKSKILIVGIPRSRHEDILALQLLLKKAVDGVLEFDKSTGMKSALIFSGDLSHTHDKDGPYGFDPSSKVFDNTVIQWMKSQSDLDYQKLLELQPTALACGMAGIGMINNLFSKLKLNNEILFYELPTYFGMGVGRWLPD